MDVNELREIAKSYAHGGVDRVSQLLLEAADRIAALEAEKAAREAQKPVERAAWSNAWDGSVVLVGPGQEDRHDGRLYRMPPVPRVDPDWLANVIRTVDGNHTMGAGALAEKIAEAINGRAK